MSHAPRIWGTRHPVSGLACLLFRPFNNFRLQPDLKESAVAAAGDDRTPEVELIAQSISSTEPPGPQLSFCQQSSKVFAGTSGTSAGRTGGGREAAAARPEPHTLCFIEPVNKRVTGALRDGHRQVDVLRPALEPGRNSRLLTLNVCQKGRRSAIREQWAKILSTDDRI